MIDHVSIAVRDLEASARFYETLLAPLGMRSVCAKRRDTVGFGKTYPEFWLNARPQLSRHPTTAARMSACARQTPRRSMPFMPRRSPPARSPTARPASARNIARLLRRLHPRPRRQPHRSGDVSRRRCRSSEPALASAVHIRSAGTVIGTFRGFGHLARRVAQHRQDVLDIARPPGGRYSHRRGTNCTARMCSSSASSGSQKPLMLASRIGFLWRPSCAQVSCSTSFLQRADRRPAAPRRRRPIEHLALALVHVAGDDDLVRASAQDVRVRPRKSGMMPVTSPPWSSTASASAPIMPTEPPP